MICVGIDVAKDKHDCFILSSEGEVLADVFTIPNNAEGFATLLQTIRCCTRPADKIKVGLEATGHYSYNILGFLLDCGLPSSALKQKQSVRMQPMPTGKLTKLCTSVGLKHISRPKRSQSPK